jgi:IclR family transcriptional regulator, KDG regulon repressor
MPDMAEASAPIESVDRALRVVRLLGEHAAGLSLDELSRRADIPKSSLHRTLAALRHGGFASQAPDSGRYLLGTEVLRVAFAFHEQLDLRALLHPLLVRLRDETNETVHMAVLDGGDVVYLDKQESSHAVKLSSSIGGRNPAHATGVGKALLAWTYATDDLARGWVEEHAPLPRRTEHTIADEAPLLGELTRIREQGYALDMEESERGVRCVAVPIFYGLATPSAAISVSAPRDRLSSAVIERTIPRMRRVVRELVAG